VISPFSLGVALTMASAGAAGDGTQAVVLPYTDGYEMVVVLPAPGRLADLEQAVADAGGDLDTVVGEFAPADLAPQLQALGMALAFDTDQADFSNITTDEPLSISAVVQQANITVDEAGTEAAAGTCRRGTLRRGGSLGHEPSRQLLAATAGVNVGGVAGLPARLEVGIEDRLGVLVGGSSRRVPHRHRAHRQGTDEQA